MHSLESNVATSQGRSDATAPLPEPPVLAPPVPGPVLPVPPVPLPDSPTIEPAHPVSAINNEIDRANGDCALNLRFLIFGSTQR